MATYECRMYTDKGEGSYGRQLYFLYKGRATERIPDFISTDPKVLTRFGVQADRYVCKTDIFDKVFTAADLQTLSAKDMKEVKFPGKRIIGKSWHKGDSILTKDLTVTKEELAQLIQTARRPAGRTAASEWAASKKKRRKTRRTRKTKRKSRKKRKKRKSRKTKRT